MAMIKRCHKNHLTPARRTHRTKLLFKALEVDNVPIIKLLLKDGGIRINARLSGSRRTLLHTAVFFEGSIAVVRRLVRVGCLINSADRSGDTALHIAVRYHKINLARHLIRLGANVRAKNTHGETPLQLLVANKSHVDVLREMIPNGDRYQAIKFYGIDSLRLATAAWRQRDWIPRLLAYYHQSETIYDAEFHQLVKMLLDVGADVNARDVNDCSPLHCAVYTGDTKLVKTLVDAGADLNHTSDVGTTALHDAVLCGNEAMVHLLLSHGARVDIEIEDVGDTALHWATRLNINKSHVAVIRRLMDFGSDLNQENFDAETPFNHILQFGDIELVNLFIYKYKADLHSVQLDGSNALTFAAQNEHEQVMDLVLENEIDVNHRCIEDRLTPLHHASGMSLLENVRRLISRGADINAKDVLERTPLFNCIFERKFYDGLTDIPMAFIRANYTKERRQVIRLLLESGADLNNLAETSELNIKQSVLEYAYLLKDIEACKLIIEYAAEVEARTHTSLFDEHNRQVIEENAEIARYYQKCRDELTAMRTTKITEGSFVTYFSVLTEQLDVVARYTRNHELVENFRSNKLQRYPVYLCRLIEKFDLAVARQKTIQEVCTVLSTILQFADLTDVAFENIFRYLSEKDVKLLTGRVD